MNRNCWPIHPPPQEGELLSSWMTRIASAHGVSVQCLCWETWPDSDVLMHDIDRRPLPGLIEDLALRSRHPITKIQQMVLPSLVGRLLDNFPSSSGWVQWILPTHLRARASHGLQYCPECLAEDIEPHWRLAWRLAFVTTCTRHSRLLRDNCPSCGAAPNLLSLFMGRRPAVEPAPVYLCRWCGHDFRGRCDYPCIPVPPAKGVSYFETSLLQALEDKWIDVQSHGLVHSVPFFRGFHLILTMLASQGNSRELREIVSNHMEIENPVELMPGRNHRVLFEVQGVAARHKIMEMAAWLMEDWPHRFVLVCREASLSGTRSTLELQRQAPYWYWKVTDEYLGLKFARWRHAVMPDGLNLSYGAISRRLQSRKLLAQERRIRFVRDHPELWKDYLGLTTAMRDAGLYSPKSSVSILVSHCPLLVDLAMGKRVIRRITSSLVICRVSNRRQIVLIPSNSPSLEEPKGSSLPMSPHPKIRVRPSSRDAS